MADSIRKSDTWVVFFDLLFADSAGERALGDDEQALFVFRASILVRLLIALEQAGVNGGTAELDALREIRNAVVHNNGDLSKNNNPDSLGLVERFLSRLEAEEIVGMNREPIRPFFRLDGTSIVFDQGSLSGVCRQFYMLHVPRN